MDKVLDFQVIFTLDEDGWYYVECPAIPGCHSQGKTLKEARKNIEEAIRLCMKHAEQNSKYRSQIVFPDKSGSFIAIEDVTVPRPAFL